MHVLERALRQVHLRRRPGKALHPLLRPVRVPAARPAAQVVEAERERFRRLRQNVQNSGAARHQHHFIDAVLLRVHTEDPDGRRLLHLVLQHILRRPHQQGVAEGALHADGRFVRLSVRRRRRVHIQAAFHLHAAAERAVRGRRVPGYRVRPAGRLHAGTAVHDHEAAGEDGPGAGGVLLHLLRPRHIADPAAGHRQPASSLPHRSSLPAADRADRHAGPVLSRFGAQARADHHFCRDAVHDHISSVSVASKFA